MGIGRKRPVTGVYLLAALTESLYFTTTIFMGLAYNARMLKVHNTIPIHFTPLQHALVWFFLAVVFFSLAGGSYYWNESAQYHTYAVIGLVFTVLGFIPLGTRAFLGKAK